MRSRPIRSLRVMALALSLAASSGALARAQDPAPPRLFDLPAGPLNAALKAFALQSGEQILYDPVDVDGAQAPAVHGRLPADEALARLLAGTSLVVEHPRPGVVTLRQARGAGASAGDVPASVDAVVVTGSLIRGRSEGASPLVTLDRETLDREGRATVADALSALPQVFNGTATPQSELLFSDGVAANTAVSTGVNLRGVGNAATLVLLNGRRLPGAGLNGDFADVSAVPAAAVDRIEVLLDGASALYGSDAIGGVVNIRLRTDYEGAETRLRIGGASQGGAFGTVVGQTFGHAWSGGHLLVSYEYQQQDALPARDRPYTATTDLRPLGGTDHRLIYSFPANILGLDPDTGGFTASFAAPSQIGAAALQPGDFRAGVANLENIRTQADVLPAQTRHSLYLDASQAIGSRFTLSADALYAHRAFRFALPEALSVFEVTPADPYFVSPDGATDQLVGYAFGRELGPTRNSGSSDQAAASVAGELKLGSSWRLETVASFAQNDELTRSFNTVNSALLDEALGNTPDDPLTPYSAARDGYFNPYGAGPANSAAVLAAVGSGYSAVRNLSRLETLDLKADGDVLELPGGELKAALGAQVRHESFKPSAVSFLSRDQPHASGGDTFSRTVSAVFAELRVPLVGPGNARPGLRALELSLAGRVEHYDDVGTTGNPKLGVVWRPFAPVKLRASWGTSFRAPSLTQVFGLQGVDPSFLPRGSDTVLALIQVGGNRDLKPETATTWSAGLDWAPPQLKGFSASVTAFEIRYRDRISQPAYEDLSNALTNPDYAAFVRLVSPKTDPADLARVRALLAQSTSPSTSLFAPTDYGALVDARYVNASGLTVRGVDLLLTQHFKLGTDAIDLSADAAYLADYDRTLTPASSPVALQGLTGQPSDLRLKGVAGWTHGAFDASLVINVAAGSRTPSGARVSDWSTLDLGVGWRSPVPSGPLHGLDVRLNIQNVADSDPPFYDSPFGVGYDVANADALGRVVSLQMTRKW